MKASEVITIGRSLRRAASVTASTAVFPRAIRSLANSTMRMAFFAVSPMVVSNPTLK